MNKYIFNNQIGKGSRSDVYKVYNIENKKYYACKKISLLNQLNNINDIKKEIEIIELVSNDKSFIKIIEYFYDDFNYHIIMELADGNILDYIKCLRICNEDTIKNIFVDIFNAIKKLHLIDILHGDLKFENILYKISDNESNEIDIKICDFGLSKIIKKNNVVNLDNYIIKLDNYEISGTIGYMAPEIFKGIYTCKSDIYSLGKMLYYILTEEITYDDKNYKNIYFYNFLNNKINSELFYHKNWNKLSIESKYLLIVMLDKNYNKRYDIYDCIRCKWLSINIK